MLAMIEESCSATPSVPWREVKSLEHTTPQAVAACVLYMSTFKRGDLRQRHRTLS